MPIETASRLCRPSAAVTSDSLVEQVSQIEDLAHGRVAGREFFRRNHFTDGLKRLLERGFERLAGRADDGAFYLTQAMGGGKTHSLIAFGLLASARSYAARWSQEYMPEQRSALRRWSFSTGTKIRRTSCGDLSGSSSVKAR